MTYQKIVKEKTDLELLNIFYKEAKEYETDFIRQIEKELILRDILDKYDEVLELHKPRVVKVPDTLLNFVKSLNEDDILYYFEVENELTYETRRDLKKFLKELRREEVDQVSQLKIGYVYDERSEVDTKAAGQIIVYDDDIQSGLIDFTTNELLAMTFDSEDYTKEMKEMIVVEIIKSYIDDFKYAEETYTANTEVHKYWIKSSLKSAFKFILALIVLYYTFILVITFFPNLFQ